MGWLVVPTVVPPLAAGLVWSSCTTPAGLLHHPLLRYLGRRSYSIYLWHYPLIMISRMAFGASLAGGTLALVLAVGIAELSWRVIESPFLGRRPSSREGAESPVPFGA
jgi:peptidoglycan/LPS O-acetylase OafA/YrhL